MKRFWKYQQSGFSLLRWCCALLDACAQVLFLFLPTFNNILSLHFLMFHKDALSSASCSSSSSLHSLSQSCADIEMTRGGVRPATWRLLCSPSLPSLPPLPPSPQLLTTSGYTCFVEFRFQTERCLLCSISLQDQYHKQVHTVSLWPCGRRGEPLTAYYTDTPFKTSPAPASCRWASSPPHPRQPTCTPLSPREQINLWRVCSSAGH